MTARSPKKKGSDLGSLITKALKSKRLTLPETAEEIAAAEAELASLETPVPDRLRDPWGFLDTNVRLRLRAPPAPPVSQEVQQELARAARSGGKLTREVLERMHRDREATEAKAEKNEDE